MAHLLGVIGNAYVRYTQRRLSETDMWFGAYSKVRRELREASRIVDLWSNVTHELTSRFWRGGMDGHVWEGDPFVDDALSGYSKRLSEVLRIRSTYEEVRSHCAGFGCIAARGGIPLINAHR